MKNAIIWDVIYVALVRTDVSEERIATIIRVKGISQLGKRYLFLVTANVVPISLIVVTLMMEVIASSEPHGVTSRKTAIFNFSLMDSRRCRGGPQWD
jgi:hypothetical protein